MLEASNKNGLTHLLFAAFLHLGEGGSLCLEHLLVLHLLHLLFGLIVRVDLLWLGSLGLLDWCLVLTVFAFHFNQFQRVIIFILFTIPFYY